MIDVAIIGGGIVGDATAYMLSQYRLSVSLFERENDIATGATRANSAIIHAGYDPKPGTLMAELNVKGAAMAEQLCRDLDVPYRNIGSMVLALTDEDMRTIEMLYQRGVQNGVPDLQILTAEEVLKQEPHVSRDVKGALYAPSAGIVGPWEYALAMAETAVMNGVVLHLEHEVTGINDLGDHYRISTNKGDYIAKYVINATGTDSATIHQMVAAPSFRIIPCKGEYYLMDKSEGDHVNHVLFQCPTKAGKGILVAPTVGGNLIVGPTATNTYCGKETSTSSEGLAAVRSGAALSVPDIPYRQAIRTFAGVRANTDRDDFIIEEVAPRFIDLAGIKSPGLTAAPAIGIKVTEMLQSMGLPLERDPFAINTRHQKRFRSLPPDEKAALIAENPQYGHIICRCETITEGEIVDALHSPIPARSVDGVKRRTGAGLGRCQGGFCGPRVLEIIARERGVSPLSVCKDTAGSRILVGAIGKEGEA
ncbi:MAG: NAD(P)/FAD-dependent oxidoreductase [Ruminococcaceae bacterium]|nr:NAD(P)/FAD-dependent oxidoreductase [Oscillospiraceae bacterium]